MLLRLAVPVVVEIAVRYPVAVRVCLFSITAPSGHPFYAEALRPAGASVKEFFFWCVEGTAERFWKRFLTPRHLPDDDDALPILGCVSWGFPTLPPPSRLALGHARWPDPRPPPDPQSHAAGVGVRHYTSAPPMLPVEAVVRLSRVAVRTLMMSSWRVVCDLWPVVLAFMSVLRRFHVSTYSCVCDLFLDVYKEVPRVLVGTSQCG